MLARFQALADLPSTEVLIAKMLGSMQAPAQELCWRTGCTTRLTGSCPGCNPGKKGRQLELLVVLIPN